MPRRQPPQNSSLRTVPRHWLMVDARLGDAPERAVRAMPPRGGVVVRPHALPEKGRAAAVLRIRRTARAKHHLLLIAGKGSSAGFDGRHGWQGAMLVRKGRILSLPIHDRQQAQRARRMRADLIFVSPIFATRSHPGAKAIGLAGFNRLAAWAARPAIALGGMNARLYSRLRGHGAAGWAAIDAWKVPDR